VCSSVFFCFVFGPCLVFSFSTLVYAVPHARVAALLLVFLGFYCIINSFDFS